MRTVQRSALCRSRRELSHIFACKNQLRYSRERGCPLSVCRSLRLPRCRKTRTQHGTRFVTALRRGAAQRELGVASGRQPSPRKSARIFVFLSGTLELAKASLRRARHHFGATGDGSNFACEQSLISNIMKSFGERVRQKEVDKIIVGSWSYMAHCHPQSGGVSYIPGGQVPDNKKK